MFIILILCFTFCSAGDISVKSGKLHNLFKNNAMPSMARSLSAPAAMAIRSKSKPTNKSLKVNTLKIDGDKRKQAFVTKVKSSEHQQNYMSNNNEQIKISFNDYYRVVNEYFGYRELTFEYLGQNVPKKIIAKIALGIIDAIKRHLNNEQLNDSDQTLPYVLTPEYLAVLPKDGDQFSEDELIGNVRVVLNTDIRRVEDPRKRALPSDQQSKIVWLKDLPYMSPQQVKNRVIVSGEKDIVWSFGIMFYEMIYGFNPMGDQNNALQPKQQWNWIPMNDKNGQMLEVTKKINEEQETVEFCRDKIIESLESNLPMVVFGGSEEFDSLLESCLQNDPEKRISLNALSQRINVLVKKTNSYVFENRQDAGQKLAKVLGYLDQMEADIVVLALPRGGVPVAYEIAKSLKAPLGLLFTKKIGYPGKEEIGIAAVADGNPPQIVLSDEAKENLHKYIQQQGQEKLKEIERQKLTYLTNRPPIPLDGRVVIVVDDGLATGISAQAALAQLAQQNVALTMFASPVCPRDTIEKLQNGGVKIICLEIPPNFTGVSRCYKHFDQTTDEEVIRCLDNAKDWMG